LPLLRPVKLSSIVFLLIAALAWPAAYLSVFCP
jgi:hypothetical protein